MTADQWRQALDAELVARQPEMQLYDDYYDGDHRLLFATNKFKEAFGDVFGAFATNWCGLVVDVAVERLGINGFRFGEDDADEEASVIWQANALDAGSIRIHTNAAKFGTGYLIVGPPRQPGGEPVITVEDPRQVIVAHDPSDRRIRLAALKKYRNSRGDLVQVVYEPHRVTTFVADGVIDRAVSVGLYVPEQATSSDVRMVAQVPNPVGAVIAIPVENAPDDLKGGRSDLKPAISLNDAANKFFMDMIHSSEFTSFPQRVATGVELPRDPITGEVSDATQIRAAVSRLWAFEDPETSVTSLPQGELGNYIEAIELAVQHLSAQTRIPPQYLLARLANISDKALVSAETGLVARTKRKWVDYGDPWEEAMRLAFAWRAWDRRNWASAGDDAWRATLTEAETIWRDPESRDPVTLTQSLQTKRQIGVPEEVLWEEAGYTPQQIRRMKKLREAELAKQEALAQQQGVAPPEQAPTVGIANEGNKLALSGLPGPPPPPEDPQAKPKKPAPANA
jgi:hypothetical protein